MAIKPEEFRSFVLDVSEQSATGILTLALEIIGDRSESQKNMAPSGVTGIFYLQSLARPTQMTSLSGPWFAADEDKFLTPVQPSKPGKYTYLETRFTLPKNWPTKRLYLQSPDAHLGWIVLNDQVLGTPAFMRELDISGLVRKDGENILRWLPNSLRPPGHTQTSDKPIPELQLTWLP